MSKKPTRDEAENAVRTLIAWAGDDPAREELLDTPKRVVKAYEEFFSGYEKKIDDSIAKLFENNYQYDEMIVLKDIDFESFCEHHMVPIVGRVFIGYIPDKKIIGLSKLARIVDVFAKRLQIQERLTMEISKSLQEVLKPKGVGVIVESVHHCLTTRGAHKLNSKMITSYMTGCFKENNIRQEFWGKYER